MPNILLVGLWGLLNFPDFFLHSMSWLLPSLLCLETMLKLSHVLSSSDLQCFKQRRCLFAKTSGESGVLDLPSSCSASEIKVTLPYYFTGCTKRFTGCSVSCDVIEMQWIRNEIKKTMQVYSYFHSSIPTWKAFAAKKQKRIPLGTPKSCEFQDISQRYSPYYIFMFLERFLQR